MDIQRKIGADIIMAFDECPPGQSEYGYAKNSLELTQRWLERCVKRLDSTEPLYGYHQSLFPIVQGCTFRDLREKAAEHAVALDREGYAIGATDHPSHGRDRRENDALAGVERAGISNKEE